MKIVISSGHGRHIRGASGILDEVFEARNVVEKVHDIINKAGGNAVIFHDNTSTTQNENLNTIVDFHNSQTRDLDVSVHFNAYVETDSPMGTEVLYVTQNELAMDLSAAVAKAGEFINRGAKYRSDLFFLNNTHMPAVLIEVCFVDSTADADAYHRNFDAICRAIAEGLGGVAAPPETSHPDDALLHVKGPCSWFGGPNDTGVSPSEGLAFLYDIDDAPHLFLAEQPSGTTGLARRLDPRTFYVACRWDYSHTPKEMLSDHTIKAIVRAHNKQFLAYPADWGPNESTGRVADLSPSLLNALGLTTDDEVEVIYPAK